MDIRVIIAQLQAAPNEQLFELAGLKAIEISTDFERALTTKIDTDAQPMGAIDDLRERGEKMVRFFERELFKLLCSTSKTDRNDAEVLWTVIAGASAVDVAHELAKWLMTNYSVLPVVAVIVALYVGRNLPRKATRAACEMWSERLA